MNPTKQETLNRIQRRMMRNCNSSSKKVSNTGISVQMYKVAHMFSVWVPNGYKNTKEAANASASASVKKKKKTEQQMWKMR